MMKLKQGVRINGIKPELVVGLMICEGVFRELGREVVVTSVVEGKHKWASLHYAGAAFDLRSKHLPEGDKEVALMEMIQRLGDDFDVLHEAVGTPIEHYHVEYQPKAPH